MPNTALPQTVLPEKTLQRAGPMAYLASLLRGSGVAPDDVTRACNSDIDLDGVAADQFLPLPALMKIMATAVQLTGDELLPVKLGEHYRWHNHGIIHRLGLTAPTLRHALLDFCEWQRLYSQAAVVYFHKVGEDFVLGYGLHVAPRETARHLYAVSARVGANCISDLTRGAVIPVEIQLCVSPPHDVVAIQRHFNCPVRFNQSQCAVVIAGRDVDYPMPAFDPAARAQLQDELRARDQGGENIVWQVERLIRPQLLQEDPGMEGAARQFGMHPRTLRRALAAEGTTFEIVRDGVRNAMARELLDITQLGIGEISAILAFSSHAAFVRAFQRWNGMTPSAWRESVTTRN